MTTNEKIFKVYTEKYQPADKIELEGNSILIKLFPIVEKQGSFIIQKTKLIETEGGRVKVDRDEFNYQPRGVVVNVPAALKDKYEIGDIVRLNHRLMNEAVCAVFDCVTTVGSPYSGLYLASLPQIIGKEYSTTELVESEELNKAVETILENEAKEQAFLDMKKEEAKAEKKKISTDLGNLDINLADLEGTFKKPKTERNSPYVIIK